MAETIAKQLGDYGLLGLMVLALGYVTLRLWQDVTSGWRSRLTETRELLTAVSEASQNYRALQDALESRTADLAAMIEVQQATVHSLNAIRETLDAQATAQQRQGDLLRRLVDVVTPKGAAA